METSPEFFYFPENLKYKKAEDTDISKNFNSLSENSYISSFHFLKDEFDTLIKGSINEKLKNLEFTNHVQEKQIFDLMLTLYSHTSEVENIKVLYNNIFIPQTNYNPFTQKKNLFNTSNSKFYNRGTINLNESLNKSVYSVKSKRSFSNTSESKKILVKEKLGTQKVSINIDLKGNQSQKLFQSSNLIKEVKILENNLKPNLNNKRKSIVILCPFDQKNSSSVINNNNKNKFTKFTPSQTKFKNNNKSNNTNSTAETNKNSLNQIRPSFKFEPKKKNISNSSSNQMPLNNLSHSHILSKSSLRSESVNVSAHPIHSRNNSENITKFICNAFPTNYQTEKSSNKSISFSNKNFFSFICNRNNKNIFIKIFEFLKSNKGIINFKKMSKVSRDAYFDFEICEIEKILNCKIKNQNPLYNIQITNADIFSYKLILSYYCNNRNNENDEGLKNIIKILHTILFYKDFNHEDSEEEILPMIFEIESSANDDKNIYSKYKEIIYSLKNNSAVYASLKSLTKSRLFFREIVSFINKLENEDKLKFEIISELIISIEKLLRKEVDMELVLDIEILTHKLGFLKNYKFQIY